MRLAIYAVDGVRLGDITHYDTECCLLTVEKGIIFKPTVLIVPFNVIWSIDRDAALSTRIARDIRGWRRRG